MKKPICQLKPGDKFIDTLGEIQLVVQVGDRKYCTITGEPARVKVHFKTPRGNTVSIDHFADREVEVYKK